MAYRSLSVQFSAPNAEPVRPLPWSVLVDLVLLMVCLFLIGAQAVTAAHPAVTPLKSAAVETVPVDREAVVIVMTIDERAAEGYTLSVLGEPVTRARMLERLAESDSQQPVALLVDADLPAAKVAALREQIEKASGRFAHLRLRVEEESR